ncbi:MAG: DNA polymerase/3'-5' exonuclease PolX [Nanoarchaeota archaeon]
MRNIEVAKLLYKIADILEFLGVDFKPAAYRRAASNIESLSEDIGKIFNENRLEEISGIGKHIAEKISEYLKTGKLKYYEELKKRVPIDLDELMKIPEIGPKKARLLYERLKIKNISDLKGAALSHKIRNLERMGIKSEDSILRGIEFLEKNQGKVLLGYVLPIAKEIEELLRQLKEVELVNVAGSVRRMKETIGDIDILVVSRNPTKVVDYFIKMNNVQEILARGETKSSVILSDGLQIDLRVVERKNYGAALNYFTGSKEHNIALRKIALSKGFKLNEYGIYLGNKFIGGKDENEVYSLLGLKYIEPELRENTGEIDASKRNKLPNLIKYGDIKGDLHIHTKFSDGQNTIEEMAAHSKKIGYEYIAITDHSNLAVAGGMNDKDLLRYIKKIRKINFKDLAIFAGSEVNISKYGSLDLKNSTLKELDIVIGSVHSYFKMGNKEMTNRILKALDNNYINILGHPTGRLINRREPFEFDADKVFEKAKERNVILEINAHPERLDLKDTMIKMAKKYKVKFVINTDSHSTADFSFMRLGIGQARRGWLESKNVINSYRLRNLKKALSI